MAERAQGGPDAAPSMAQMMQMAVQVAEIYAARFGAPKDAGWVLHKITEEVGELTGAWLQARGAGRGAATQEDVADELADALGFLLVFAAREGIDPAQALARKWGKYLE